MDERRILIISQHPLFDEGLVAMLRSQPAIRVVGVCRDPKHLLQQAQDLQADVLVVIGDPDEILGNAFHLLEDIAQCLIIIQTTDSSLRTYRRHLVLEGDLQDVLSAIDIAC